MGPKHKCSECKWVGGDHAADCLIGAAQEAEDDGSEIEVEPTAEWDDELADDDD